MSTDEAYEVKLRSILDAVDEAAKENLFRPMVYGVEADTKQGSYMSIHISMTDLSSLGATK
jgi:hypothetical protein